MDQEDTERIPSTSKILLLSTAVLFDVAQAVIGLTNVIPYAGQIISSFGGYFISFFAILTFSVWFLVRGVNFFKGRKMGRRITSLVCEYIPIINSFPIPGWTIATYFTIKSAEEEDKEKTEAREKRGGGRQGGRYSPSRGALQRIRQKTSVQ